MVSFQAASDDPFATYALESMDWKRVTAAIFELPETSFPGVLELGQGGGGEDDPFAEPSGYGWDQELLGPMLARWSDLNPEAAMDWLEAVEEGREDQSMKSFKELVCQETLRTDPELAVRFMERLMVEQNRPEMLSEPWNFPMPDPFADSGPNSQFFESVSGESFFGLFFREHPEAAMEAYAQASPALQYDGQEAWIQGMVRSGRFEEAMEFAAGLPAERREDLEHSLAYQLGAENPQGLENWLQGRSGPDVRSLQWEVMRSKYRQDPDHAAEWYLSRAEDAEDRAERIAELTERTSTTEESVAWLRRKEQEGEDVGLAWTRVVKDAPSKEAWPLLDKVPTAQREAVEKSLFRKGAKEIHFSFEGNSEGLLEIPPEHRALAEEQGMGEEYEAFVQAHNAELVGKLLGYLEGRGLVEMEEE